ncbi:Elongator subunit IKI3 [Kluyveromyces lactis]|uniref:Elongator complex protein 1 n=1 Tax=Kluyveromyces lactis (strain ATCC 8585 / CBS 2359 / DSM 70799 / NBRC 1267 / NRRL Y-1140 / WM37) TaxID=284590 RepID=Q6CPF8_KLULA|nr:uncharacterized protein KLLA0_E05237g [Kluyveromyces lactis]CAG99268.1 KLLA0E05237p [Kluyveromyces lactis]|eukprot:XP_454181.1 uncharacterized protein KLLA0_E05237g [Kluyveromyces lactis]
MRNLITLNHGKLQPVSQTLPDLELYTSCFDTLSDSITCVLGAADIGALEVQQYMKDGSMNVLASFYVQSYNDKLLSFIHFDDINELVFVFQQGDIISVTYDPATMDYHSSKVSIVGSIDLGIEAAEWSADQETLAIVTFERNVVLLSRQLEPIVETSLQVEDLKISKHVTVGWGKKDTQFRGKGARAMEREALESLKASGLVGNELRDPTMPYRVDTGAITELDSRKVKISWRGDCEYFAVTTIETVKDPSDESKTVERRALRVFTRDGQLDSASEPVDGMNEHLSWKPQGSLIASVQRKTHIPDEEGLDLIFFERNGLRHGEFDLRLPSDEPVLDLCWNANSEILTIVLIDRVQLWTTKNYHWFLKQEFYFNNITYAKWHPEKDFTLMVGDSEKMTIVDFAYKMTAGPTMQPFDNGTSIVIDGNVVNITPLGIANVPPPLYFRDFECPNNVLDAACSVSNEVYAAITKDELVIASVPSLKAMKNGKHPWIVSTFNKSSFGTAFDTLRQLAFINDNTVAILLDTDNLSRIALIDITDNTNPSLITIIETFDKVVLLRSQFDYNFVVFETRDGKITQLSADGQLSTITRFPQLVYDFRVKRVESATAANDWGDEQSKTVAFGLTNTGKLFANEVQLTSAVTSIEITDSFLLFTTAQHNLQFIHLNTTDYKPLATVEDDTIDERVRAVERGSILVNVIPSKAAVILQAARGNLETIYPRIMVLSGVRANIIAKNYKEAFVTCRTHRINLDILYDYDPELFLNNLPHFITEIERVDYLDLFISSLLEDDVTKTKYRETLNFDSSTAFDVAPPPPTEMQLYMKKKMFNPKTSKVNKVCQAILDVLLNTPNFRQKYLQSIITAYACQNPPNLRDALQLIDTVESEEQKDSTVTYLCFLQDVNVIYKVALSLYDIHLTLAVAQKSQMDPREYLPFLQSLLDAEPLRRKFMIDDYLQNYELAIEHLAAIDKVDNTVSSEFIEYVEEHDLFKHALNIFKSEQDRQNIIYHVYAKSLSSQQQYGDAGIIHEMLGEWKEALDAYTLGKKWNEAMSVVLDHFPDKTEDIATELISSLTFEHRYVDASQLEIRFMKNIKAGMDLLCRAYDYEAASLIAIAEHKSELIEEIVDPALGDGFGTIAELLADCKGQVNSQLKRLRELRQKKAEDPFAFYGEETDQADDVSIAASETSTKESFFTRYTGKTSGTAKTGASRKTAKNKRRQERKRARGKKGTIYEEEYLIQSIGRLIDRLYQTQPEAIKLIEGLLRRNKREQAYQIQKNFMELIDLLKENVQEIYSISEKDRERIDDDGQVYYLPEIPVPEIKEFPKRNIVDF